MTEFIKTETPHASILNDFDSLGRKPRMVELFSGNGDITKAFRAAGWEAVSVDYDPEKDSDLTADVYELEDDFLKSFDFIWASPDCTTYSKAQHGLHRKWNGVPVSEYAKFCDEHNRVFVRKLLRLGVPFIIENPLGAMRNMDFMQGCFHATVYYSRYGLAYPKPTDLFSNVFLNYYFDTRPLLTGVSFDSTHGFLNRCKMPELLIRDIIEAAAVMVKDSWALHGIG